MIGGAMTHHSEQDYVKSGLEKNTSVYSSNFTLYDDDCTIF